MPKSTYRGGKLQFTFKVDALDRVDPENLKSMKSVFMDLDLNPESKIFEVEDVVFDAKKLAAVFLFMHNFVLYLDSKKARKAQLEKCGTKTDLTKKIGRIILNKNSPATTNLYYVASYNGDLRPPAGR